MPYLHHLAGVGLDSGERGNPPAKFDPRLHRGPGDGPAPVAHAGEEGPAAYIREALDRLAVVRIDHGVRCDEDPALVDELAARRVPLTVCPLSNLKLRVVKDLARSQPRAPAGAGLCVTINSDDPAYFGGYIGDNYRATAAALGLDAAALKQLAQNAVEAAWLPLARRVQLLAEIDAL
jgi:adenosine deaminase